VANSHVLELLEVELEALQFNAIFARLVLDVDVVVVTNALVPWTETV